MTVPLTLAASALYDDLLQAALRRFFPRAVLETESLPSLSSHGRLSMDPTDDPAALAVRWFGTRHVLRVPAHQPFTVHEVRLARAIGAVLSTRYSATFDPHLMARRPGLFQGTIEDRYIGAFLDAGAYGDDDSVSRADRIASAIEVLRVAALSSYENKPISTGVLLLDADEDPCAPIDVPTPVFPYSQQLTGIKAFYRLCDGVDTLLLTSRSGRLLSTVDVDRWSRQLRSGVQLTVPCARAYAPHARATQGNRHVCVVLSPSHEIKIFAEGAQMFSFRNAQWHLLDLEARYESWASAAGDRRLAERLFQAALDLAEQRHGALMVVLDDPAAALPQLVAPQDVLMPSKHHVPPLRMTRQELLSLLAATDVMALDLTVFEALASLDGATVLDRAGHVLAAGAILRHPPGGPDDGLGRVEGARTTAALTASRFGAVLKVSEDGVVSFFDSDRYWEF